MVDRSEFKALEGWIGCPHCGRPVNASLSAAQAKLQALRVAALRLGELRGDHRRVFGLLDTMASEVMQEMDAEASDLFPDLVWPKQP